MSKSKHGTVASRPCDVLLVDDNRDLRETLKMVLELSGFRVNVAGDGVEGVRQALAAPPESAIIDIGLPGLDGYEVARSLRRSLGKQIFLIAQTGYGQPEDRRRAYEAGFDLHLVKPVPPETLCRCLTTRAAG
jgi:CheY-like chemotaxis protein